MILADTVGYDVFSFVRNVSNGYLILFNFRCFWIFQWALIKWTVVILRKEKGYPGSDIIGVIIEIFAVISGNGKEKQEKLVFGPGGLTFHIWSKVLRKSNDPSPSSKKYTAAFPQPSKPTEIAQLPEVGKIEADLPLPSVFPTEKFHQLNVLKRK